MQRKTYLSSSTASRCNLKLSRYAFSILARALSRMSNNWPQAIRWNRIVSRVSDWCRSPRLPFSIRGGALQPPCLGELGAFISDRSSCQLLAHIPHPDTPAKERGKAFLERGCE